MSQDYHQGIYGFSNELETSQQQQEQQQHISQQIRMLSEMFGFPQGGVSTATELLESQISQSYRNPRLPPPPPTGAASAADWFSQHQLSLMNSQRQRSPPSPSTTSTLHMLLPNHSSSTPSPNLQTFHTATGGAFGWVPNNENQETNNPNDIVMEGQGLSLSLSSSLCLREGGILSFGQGGGGSSNAAACLDDMHGGVVSHNHGLHHVGTSIGGVNILRNSKYAKPAQELLEEFCRVGRGQMKKNKCNPSGGGGNSSSSSSSKDFPHLSAADRLEHQRRKVKLLTMLDEVDRRYTHYCEQMQMVANSFDMMMGFGAAVPYTCLAQKAMSRHFRCLKDAISAQLKQTCELLGEKDGGTSGITKGETPRLKMLDQSLRQQRAYHQMGMMQQEAWRPQRGLPDRSVNILRAWLFEHFLHPYPSDADKHLLARQTGLSRNQVSNWFINARVRLWKPMVEEMYQQESKDDADPQRDHSASTSTSTSANSNNAHTSTPHEIIAPESDPSFIAINMQRTVNTNNNGATSNAAAQSFPAMQETGSGRRLQPGNAAEVNESSTLIRFGANAGDVSLTLGLRHAGNLPEKSRFSVRDFGGC